MRIPAIKVNQWLEEWDAYQFNGEDSQRKPEPHFYLSSIPAPLLTRLSNVPRRGIETASGRQQASGPRADDKNIQRGHEPERSKSIKGFVNGGYPWATLRKVEQGRHLDLRKPGWLATALVMNVVKPTSSREGVSPDPEDLVKIVPTGPNTADVVIPDAAESTEWVPKGQIHPLEVIDGQHRLLAFEPDAQIAGNFELPVVLFEDLDASWQAYLFWTINISPKRIGPSLAFDLYPLLRTEEWLNPVPSLLAYRETRAQELTEALWSNPSSPWYQRIGMLGRGGGLVTQAAFVRSLTLSYFRRSDGVGERPGGLFGAAIGPSRSELLSWGRAEQAAYLIFLWSELESAIDTIDPDWARHIRIHAHGGQMPLPGEKNPAFAGEYSLLDTDQGVRGFLQVTNDISFSLANQLNIASWLPARESAATIVEDVDETVEDLRTLSESADFARELCECVATFDWRTQATPELTEETRIRQALYRSGTGYREVRRQLLRHISDQTSPRISASASDVFRRLRF